MEEILRVMVRLDGISEVEGKTGAARMIAFSGEADGPYFSGKILPHGVDTQKSEAGKPLQLSARYMLEGIDCTGKQCCLFIENNGEEAGGQIVTKHGFTRIARAFHGWKGQHFAERWNPAAKTR